MKQKTSPKKQDAANAELNAAIQTLDDTQADQITILDLEEKSSVARYFVIATANSTTHLRALREAVADTWEEKFSRHPRYEASPNTRWQVVDLGDIMVHLFTPEERQRYNLEGLWGDAKLLKMSA